MATPKRPVPPGMLGLDPAGPVPFETEHVDGDVRRRYNVAVVCIPTGERDLSRRVMPDGDAAEARGFKPGLGGDTPDDDDAFPASSPGSLATARAARDAGDPEPWRHLDGARVWYTLLLTDTEAEQHRAASNARAVTVDSTHWPI